MRAVRFERYGDEDVLDVVEVDKPEPGPGQVVVAVRATAINPGEIHIRSGALAERFPTSFPEGEGSDFAGVVDSVGPDVTAFAVGDEVLGYTDLRASHAEFVLAAVGEIVPKPAALDWPAAGSVYVAGTTAWTLNHVAQVGPGDVVVVSAAAGGVGSLAAQLARNAGADVVGVAGPANHEWLRGFGIVPVDYHGAGLADRVRAAAGGRPVTALLDTNGPAYVDLGFELGVAGERIVTVASYDAPDRGARYVFHFEHVTPAVLAEVADALADGSLVMPIAATYPLGEVRAAYRELAAGHTRGKIVLLP